MNNDPLEANRSPFTITRLDGCNSYLANYFDETGCPELEKFAQNMICFFLGFEPEVGFFRDIFSDTVVYAIRPGRDPSPENNQILKIWFAPFLGLRIETKNFPDFLPFLLCEWALTSHFG